MSKKGKSMVIITVSLMFIFAILGLVSYHQGWWSCDGWEHGFINRIDIPIKWQQKCAY